MARCDSSSIDPILFDKLLLKPVASCVETSIKSLSQVFVLLDIRHVNQLGLQ